MGFSFVYSILLPLVGALACIRVFPLSMRKFTTIITLWMYLLACGYIVQTLPIALVGIYGETPAFLASLVGESPAQTVAVLLCSAGVGFGMMLIPISYWLTIKVRKAKARKK